ncbi:DUF4286 family protein [Aquabacter spiritensis]|uniref:NIPSNAP protein n=1 Tax=Aquabacter spiritensis TaxID=933073 RepID=A0A4R3LZR9_9HYPH|nr:DUF4286 family protein [Aquabacter spiritensis]TCT06220.1 hypothetical protein EDC64_103324 [Aquabacter spiritensis]
MSGYVYLAHLSIPRDMEDAFNALYDSGYVPNLLQVPGVRACRRFKLEWSDSEMPEYLAFYEVDSPDVPKSAAWKEASVRCGWAEKIRPHLTTRRHGLFRELSQAESEAASAIPPGT